MTDIKIEDLQNKAFKQIDDLIKKLKVELHAEIFSEEFDYKFDSMADAADRKNGKSPMSEEYTAKVNSKREKLGVSNLNASGLPKDNSSELYIENVILQHVLETTQELSSETKLKNQMNISSFFKSKNN
ncbi:hypothetical protein ACJOV8_001405 [Formosa sp. 3Alg 14/1]|uniref:hypothetical protein n=1 Tax=Formosa sp. 3Alg 14/1 TaxID=3382190 RepID=UPI0039BE1135